MTEKNPSKNDIRNIIYQKLIDIRQKAAEVIKKSWTNTLIQIKKILLQIDKQISKAKSMFAQERSKTKHINTPLFQKLTPIADADLTIYKKALDFVFDNTDIKNVAITGPYSSGKSSVIESYKNENRKMRFLHISLAHFNEVQEESTLGKSKIDESTLEGKILNQLLHQINVARIPQTNFKVKRQISIFRIIKNTILIIFSLLISIYLILFEEWSKYVSKIPGGKIRNILGHTVDYRFQIAIGIILFVLLAVALFSVIKAQMTKSIIKKLSVHGNDLELFGEDTESYFDRYLNEVLYIFNNSRADAIIFEDMDRYNSNQIFVKLREINTQVNNKSKRVIRFFYLLRDDIFVSKDRTKFFDFIMPIVPIIDSSNSYEKFVGHFTEAKIFDFFDKYFLQGLSLYIDDMRILKNIYNEFLIYYEKIHSIELDNNKLLAMIVYKNLFPRDFSDLQLSRGYVFNLFAQKNSFIADEINRINKEIVGIDKKIEIVTQENLRDLDELDTLYIKFPNCQQILISGVNQNTKSNFEIIKAMKENPTNIKILLSNNWQVFDIQSALGSLDKNEDYINRKKNIEEKNKTTTNDLRIKKQNLQNMVNNIYNKRLKGIINKDNSNKIFNINYTNEIGIENNFNDIKSNYYFPLIKYLLRNGYIDETYSDYMTYFYTNSISREDKIFLRSITDENAKEYDYKLKNPEIVFSRLKPSYFEKEEILNFDLMSWLLKDRENNEQFIKKIFYKLNNLKKIEFVAEYLETQQDVVSFMECIVEHWPEITGLFLNSNKINTRQKELFVIDIMNNLSETDVIKLNEKNVLTNYLSLFSNYLSQQPADIQLLVKKLSAISVKFVKFAYESRNTDLFYAVYTNELYQISFDNISFILENIYDLDRTEDFYHKNYTLVLSKPKEPLNLYIHKNINQYLEIVINASNNIINDDEESILKILNNEDIDTDKKNSYINILNVVISNINDIKNTEYWETLLRDNKIKYCEENIFSYYFVEDHGLNQMLIDFINIHGKAINVSKQIIDDQYGEGSASKFINDIVECNELDNEVYKRIMLSSPWTYNKFSKEQISTDKIAILIDVGSIKMTKNNIIFIREKYPRLVLPFAIRNITEYIEIMGSDNVVFNEILSLLDKNMDDDLKIKMLQNTQETIPLKGKHYSEVVKQYILSNNFDFGDVSYLFDIFNSETENMKDIIISVLIKNTNRLLSDQVMMPYNILIMILGHDDLEDSKKKELLAANMSVFNINQIRCCFEILKLRDYLSVFEHRRPKFIATPVNKKILTILKDKHLIEKFWVDKKNNEYYRAQGKLFTANPGDGND
jgi:hypothetical protein